MARTKTKPGPKTMVLDRKLVKDLCEIQCTNREIAHILGCSEDTLEEQFSGELNGWKFFGRSSLRRAQWRKALYDDAEGDTVMLKHLGKHYLGQTDGLPEGSMRTQFSSADEIVIKMSPKDAPEQDSRE